MRHGGQPTAPLYQYRYNDQGQMVELVDPLGRETRLVFSEQGQQTSRTLPLGFGADGKLGTSDDSVGWPHFGRPKCRTQEAEQEAEQRGERKQEEPGPTIERKQGQPLRESRARESRANH